MKRLLRLGVAVALGALLIPSGAGAAAPDAVGWWTRTVGPVPVTAPVTVPEGGLYVAGDPSGATGVSALRVAIGDRRVGDLVLVIADGRGTPALQACVAAERWEQADGGSIDSAPAGDCEAGSSVAAQDGDAVRVAVGGLVRNGVLDVVLVPVSGTFQVAFEPPGPESLVLREGGDESAPVEVAVTPLDTAGPAPSAMPPAPSFSPAPAPAPGPIAVLPPVSNPAVTVPAGRPSAAPRLITVEEEGDRPRLIAAFVLFDLLLGYGWFLHRRRQAEGESRVGGIGGIGRFAQARQGPVPRL